MFVNTRTEDERVPSFWLAAGSLLLTWHFLFPVFIFTFSPLLEQHSLLVSHVLRLHIANQQNKACRLQLSLYHLIFCRRWDRDQTLDAEIRLKNERAASPCWLRPDSLPLISVRTGFWARTHRCVSGNRPSRGDWWRLVCSGLIRTRL